jgi:hypothetical protein
MQTLTPCSQDPETSENTNIMSRIARALLILSSLIAIAEPASAQSPKLNVVMMGEDADASSVPRTNRVFSRVQQEIMEQMNVRGLQVYDEVAVSLGVTDPGRVRRRDAELIDVARTVSRPPLDVLVVFQIYAAANKSPVSDIMKLNIRVAGRMLNVRSGQSLGSFEVVGQDLPPIPPGCNYDCILEHVGNEAKPIAGEVSSALYDKLTAFIGSAPVLAQAPIQAPAPTVQAAPIAAAPASICPGLPNAYVFKLSNFAAAEVSQVEAFISAFSCFETIRPIRQSSSTAEYWYESRIDQQRLTRNLQGMKDAMGVNFQIQFSGNSVSLTKVLTR